MGRRRLFGESCRPPIVWVGDDSHLIWLCVLKSLLVGVGADDLAVGRTVVYALDSGFGDGRAGVGADGTGLSICELVLRVRRLGWDESLVSAGSFREARH